MPLRIAIIGAGPAGCALGRLLHYSKKDIDISIFESEESLDFRSQGGTLDLRSKAGLAAIEAAGLREDFSKYARYDGEALRICDKHYLTFLSVGGSKKEHKGLARPEIDRPVLRRLLYESLPEGIVTWGKKLKKVDANNVIHFQDGTSQSGFDLIVGADGAWSKTRKRLTDVMPHYSGIAGWQISIPEADKNHKELTARVNRGSIFSFANHKSICAQQMGDGSLSASYWTQMPTDWQKGLDFDVDDSKAASKYITEKCSGWDQKLLDFVQVPEATFKARDLFMLPIGTTWDHVPGVTVIGDAAHLATPFAGRGVNEALLDSLKLSKAIVAASEAKDPKAALDKSIISFEKDMFIRGKEMQTMTYANLECWFLSDDLRHSIEKFILTAISAEFGVFTYLLYPIVYGYFFLFKLWHPPRKHASVATA